MVHGALSKLGFPRDGKTLENLVWDVQVALSPGTKIFPCPTVPLSRDKGWSKNPRTEEFAVPRQDFELFLSSLCPETMKELLSRCPEKLHCPVLLETLVKMAHQTV